MDTQATPPLVNETGIGKLKYIYMFAAALLIAAGAYFFMTWQPATPVSSNTPAELTNKFAGKKIVFVDSYHEGYEWSDGITTGIKKVLGGSGIELHIIRMDTKNNTSEDFKKAAALKAFGEISAFNPDVLIAADDNAFKYLIKEYYKDAALPVVFCGLNWDASVYGAPYSNTTGMVEVSLTTQIIDHLKPFAKGARLGYLSADTETEHKNLSNYEKIFGLKFEKTYFVKDMASWKNAYNALQTETDIIIFENNAGITDWNDNEAKDFALANIKVPVGTTNAWTMEESVFGITKIPNEQGEWSAATALQILAGTLPKNIPLVKNEKGELIINLGLAEKLNIVFPPNILKNAKVTQ